MMVMIINIVKVRFCCHHYIMWNQGKSDSEYVFLSRYEIMKWSSNS